MTYVGNAEDSKYDQTLEEAMVGPVPVGVNRFVLQSPPPNPSLIQNQDLIGVTVILLSCSYLDQKFVQIGYFVNNEYADPVDPENYPNPVDISKLYRSILANEPRVTRFPIDWTGANPATAELEQGAEEVVDDAMEEDEEDGEEEEEDDDEEDDEEDDNAEVDLEDEEEQDEEDEEEGEEGEEEDNMNQSFEYADGMEIINHDSNSIDIARMLAK